MQASFEKNQQFNFRNDYLHKENLKTKFEIYISFFKKIQVLRNNYYISLILGFCKQFIAIF